MLWAVFVLFVVEVSYGLECIDDGWSQYYGKCYLFSDAVGAMTHDQCGSYCAGFDATMLCVDGSTTENILQWYTSPMWLANSDVNDTNTYTWGPGCANHGYTHWLPSEPSSGGVGGNCVELVAGINGVEGWNSVDCANGYQSLCYCQKPATAHVDCPEGWQSDGKACYLIDLWKKPTNYPECTDFCSAYNGMPLCIEDQEKEDYILNHMGYLPSVWVAYTDNAGVGDWQWATSCPYSEYSHWSTATDMPMMGNGRCTIMYNRAQQANGLYDWHNYNCQHTTQEQYCFCQAGAGSDAVPYNADSEFSGSGSGSSSLSTSYIILIAVLGGVFVVALCGCAVWYYCALKRLGMQISHFLFCLLWHKHIIYHHIFRHGHWTEL